MAAEKNPCSRMRLWEYEQQYVLEPLESGYSQFLALSKKTGEFQLISELPAQDSQKPPRRQTVFGFLGALRLHSGVHALMVTSREHVGEYNGGSVYKILAMKFFHCQTASGPLSPNQKDDESHLRSLLSSLESTSGLYMSYNADLTNSLQRSRSVQKGHTLYQQADPRFVWNKQLLEGVADMKIDAYMLPVIQGSFQTFRVEVQKTPIKVSLIARRSIRRIGTRMWRRGANLDGDVANFVESEQILEANGHIASYVQVRGSIPVMWQQVVDLSYKPKCELTNMQETPKVIRRHFQDLNKRYGSVIALDLINQHGGEAVLGRAFASAMQEIVNDQIRYVAFDFHRICGHVHFERLYSLYDQIEEQLKKQSYFLMTDNSNVLEEQKGVARTNCIDCLDRTNVTQSLLGRKCLEAQLQRLGIFNQSNAIKQFEDFDSKFKTLWADHGDNISIQYSGTCALKGDFVRYGKRTISGILKDGYSALARYYYNNLHDGERQDALDLVAGHYTVSRAFSLREEKKLPKFFTYFPLVALVIIVGMLFTLMSVKEAGQDLYRMVHAVIWGMLTLAIMALVRSNGRQFTNKPRLCQLH